MPVGFLSLVNETVMAAGKLSLPILADKDQVPLEVNDKLNAGQIRDAVNSAGLTPSTLDHYCLYPQCNGRFGNLGNHQRNVHGRVAEGKGVIRCMLCCDQHHYVTFFAGYQHTLFMHGRPVPQKLLDLVIVPERKKAECARFCEANKEALRRTEGQTNTYPMTAYSMTPEEEHARNQRKLQREEAADEQPKKRSKQTNQDGELAPDATLRERALHKMMHATANVNEE